ncbi:MAG: hypothetical protein ABI255_02415, partial [Microbacteriaceae bacterium]
SEPASSEPVFSEPSSSEPVFAQTADENVEAAELIAESDRPAEPVEPAGAALAEPAGAGPGRVEPVAAEPGEPAPVGAPAPVIEPTEPRADRTPIAEPAGAPVTVPSERPATEVPAENDVYAGSRTDTIEAPRVAGPVYVEAPVRPKRRGNRGVGILIALVGTIIFALAYAAVVGIIGGLDTPAERFGDEYLRYLASAPFYVPVIFFFIAMVLLILIVNRASWWVYIIGAFFVGLVVYFSFFGGALLAKQAWQLTPNEAGRFVRTLWLNPFALAGGIIGHEVAIWMGAWLSARGRRLKARNAQAQAEYDAAVAAGPGSRYPLQPNVSSPTQPRPQESH